MQNDFENDRYRKNNYELTKERMRPEFLKYDQEAMIRRLQLENDREYLYLEFAGGAYRIRRSSGEVDRIGRTERLHGKESHVLVRTGIREADYLEVLSIYDFLCYSGEEVSLRGTWCLVNSLPGVGQNSGLGNTMFDQDAGYFDGNQEAFIRTCKELGGKPVSCGDIGFEIPVFPSFPLRLRFYRSDEEFPASLSVLFDENTLKYMHYETTYYVVGSLMREIRERMEEQCGS